MNDGIPTTTVLIVISIRIAAFHIWTEQNWL